MLLKANLVVRFILGVSRSQGQAPHSYEFLNQNYEIEYTQWRIQGSYGAQTLPQMS